MALRNINVTVDLKRGTSQKFKYKQFDNGCILNLFICQNKRDVSLSNYKAVANFKLPSGKIIKEDCTINYNVIFVPINKKVTNEDGKVSLEVQILNSKQVVSTFTIFFDVEKSIVWEGENERNELDD